ncbi:MAG: MFS transporter [Clostridia bacterium]|nr:MFS transporter [Clostridia bacterium]
MDNTQQQLYDSPAYKRSRAAYKWECTFEYFVALLVGDAFLANLLTYIGFSDAAAGIISSLITLAFLFQLVAVFVVRKITNTKLVAILFHSLSQLFFMSLYIIPFLPFAAVIKKPLVVVCVLLAYFGNYMVSTLIFRWGNSYVDPKKRASYTAGKEILSLLTGMVVSFGIGYIMDQFKANDNLEHGFIFSAVAIFVFCLCDFITLMLIKNDVKPKVRKGDGIPMSEVLKNTLGNKNFLSVVVLMILWDASRYIVVGFLGTYKNSLYALSVVQIINVVSQLARAAFSKPFGKYTAKRTFAKGIELGLVIAAVAMFVNIFTTPSTAFLIIIYSILYNVCLAGVSGNITNITYSYVDSQYFAEASAIKNSIGGLFGFAATLIGGKILSAIQANGNMLFGIPVYGQQVLSAISCVMLIATVLFTHFVVAKQKVMIQ